MKNLANGTNEQLSTKILTKILAQLFGTIRTNHQKAWRQQNSIKSSLKVFRFWRQFLKRAWKKSFVSAEIPDKQENKVRLNLLKHNRQRGAVDLAVERPRLVGRGEVARVSQAEDDGGADEQHKYDHTDRPDVALVSLPPQVLEAGDSD